MPPVPGAISDIIPFPLLRRRDWCILLPTRWTGEHQRIFQKPTFKKSGFFILVMRKVVLLPEWNQHKIEMQSKSCVRSTVSLTLINLLLLLPCWLIPAGCRMKTNHGNNKKVRISCSSTLIANSFIEKNNLSWWWIVEECDSSMFPFVY